MKLSFTIPSVILHSTLFVGVLLLGSWVGADGQIYVTQQGVQPSGQVCAFNLDGSPINLSLIQGLDYPWGITSDGENLYVANGRVVGKYKTSGATVNHAVVSSRSFPRVVALDGHGFLYPLDDLFNTVGKYTTSGEIVDPALITAIPGGGFPSIASDGQYLYLANSYSGYIAKFTIAGSNVATKTVDVIVPR